jgi:hypothetical protein
MRQSINNKKEPLIKAALFRKGLNEEVEYALNDLACQMMICKIYCVQDNKQKAMQ